MSTAHGKTKVPCQCIFGLCDNSTRESLPVDRLSLELSTGPSPTAHTNRPRTKRKLLGSRIPQLTLAQAHTSLRCHMPPALSAHTEQYNKARCSHTQGNARTGAIHTPNRTAQDACASPLLNGVTSTSQVAKPQREKGGGGGGGCEKGPRRPQDSPLALRLPLAASGRRRLQ